MSKEKENSHYKRTWPRAERTSVRLASLRYSSCKRCRDIWSVNDVVISISYFLTANCSKLLTATFYLLNYTPPSTSILNSGHEGTKAQRRMRLAWCLRPFVAKFWGRGTNLMGEMFLHASSIAFHSLVRMTISRPWNWSLSPDFMPLRAFPMGESREMA